jgi:hypothetical protein
MESEHQIPIWFFIGALLLVYGIIITGAGIYALFFPPPEAQRVALFQYHADIWWGLLLIVVGTLYSLRFRPDRRQQ